LEFLCVSTPNLRRITAELDESLPTDWETAADRLWQRPLYEMRILALLLASRHQRDFRSSHWTLFTRWLKDAAGWAMVDVLCCEVLAPLLIAHPALVAKTDPWPRSKNLWVRRASLVAFCVPLRQGLYADPAFEHAVALLADRDSMVTKAESWVLRAAIKHFRPRVEAFLEEHDDELAALARREVRTKLITGRKNPRRT
jgi:3-methyladenine DNA glycosylase AlkD